jgi:hypothetical protein
VLQVKRFLVERNQLAATRLDTDSRLSPDDVAAGEILLQVDQFAFTANNITYAALGDALRYWEFFPAGEQGMGIIPVWGFADVLASRCDSIAVGERLYGFLSMTSHLVVSPTEVRSGSFVDGTGHRQALPLIYNQYLRCRHDALYTADTEALQMLLRPLFTTSFLLDDFFADNDFFGATTLVLTSASSKTAIGMAYLLQRNRPLREQRYRIVGLTSAGNVDFVSGLGCYDEVISYEQVDSIGVGPAAIVDFAGNGELLGQLHEHFGPQLQYSCLVGASHWEQRSGQPRDLPGPAPQMFFAPSQAQKRVGEWGAGEFQRQLGAVWGEFVSFVGGWMNVEYDFGAQAVERVYQQALAGRLNPATGFILSLSKEQ